MGPKLVEAMGVVVTDSSASPIPIVRAAKGPTSGDLVALLTILRGRFCRQIHMSYNSVI